MKTGMFTLYRSAALRAAWPLFLGLIVCAGPVAAAPGDTTRVSVDSSGVEGNGFSDDHSVTADGRYVAFESGADNLVAEDTNTATDIFVRDRQTGLTTRVSVDSSGSQGNDFSSEPSISADGRYAAFVSGASNLVAGDTNNSTDVFVHDRQTGVTTRISVASDGAQGNGWSDGPSISADGRYVAFVSGASNLVANDTNGERDIFVRDRQTGITTRVNIASSGVQSNDYSSDPVISADGRYVTFDSAASSLVAGDTNGLDDIFVHDRQTGITTRVSVDSNGVQSNGYSDEPCISADGRYVAFESGASNLVATDDVPGGIFVHDRRAGVTTRVSVDSNGVPGNWNGTDPARWSSISADGRYVSFASFASNLVSGDTNNQRDVFVHDRQTGVTTRVSVDSNGAEGTAEVYADGSRYSHLSADGRYVTFSSEFFNLVANDTNGETDVFVHEIDIGIRSADVGILVLPDLNGNGVNELGILRDDAMLEIRDGGTGMLLEMRLTLSDGYWPVAATPIHDADGNGVPELAVLAQRQSDGRAVVEIRNLAGTPDMRQVWFAANFTPLELAVVPDADNNSVAEIAVLSRRDSDGRGLVEVKNAYGPTNQRWVWVGAGLTPLELEIVPDTDGNEVPEVAVLSRRDSDGRIVVEVKNAAGPTNPNSVWFMSGNTAIDLAVVADKDGNGVAEVAVLSKRNSDGRLVTEVKNARGPTNPAAVWFAAGQTGLALQALGDADGNTAPEIAVLSRRNSDGRILVEVKNAVGPTNPRSLWYPPGYTPLDLAILDDVDSNGIEEAGVLMSRDSDGRLMVQSRNATDPQAPKDYWFSP